MQQLHGLTLSGLHALNPYRCITAGGKYCLLSHCAVQHSQLEFIPKDKPATQLVLGASKARDTCWRSHLRAGSLQLWSWFG